MPALLPGAVRRVRREFGAAVAVACLCAGAIGTAARAAWSPCQDANLSPNAANAGRVDAATLCLIDRLRAAYHLRPLRANGELRRLATRQVNDMVSWNYFADDRPPGLTPLALIASTRYRSHAKSLSVGQNIGWGTGPYATAASMVAGWMASPGHREIILTGEYREAGVGVAPALPPLLGQELGGATYAIEFAARRF